jgi:hypothetical protein
VTTKYIYDNTTHILQPFISLVAIIHTCYNKKIHVAMGYVAIDRFSSSVFSEDCTECGIIHETITPYAPQSTGVAEWKNRTVCDLANALLQSLGMLDIRWGEAMLTVNYVLNRVPPHNREVTPNEGFKERRPDLSHLWTWGCLAKVNVPLPKKRKLGPKTVDCVFLGYAHISTTYKFLVVRSETSEVAVNIIMESHDVTFFENIFPMKNMEVDTPNGPRMTYSLPSSVYDPTPDVELRSKRQRTEKSLGDDYITYLVDEEPHTLSEAYASSDA